MMVTLFPVQNDRSISVVARTVNAAFSSDPLIQWLRPSATPWVYQDALAHRWQYRTVQNEISEGIVLQSASVGQIAQEYPRKNKKIEPSDGAVAPEKIAQVSAFEDPDIAANQREAGAVVFLYPPTEHLPWSLSSMWLSWKLWLLELFNPVKDTSCKDERVEKLMSRHVSGKKLLQAQYPKLWYLELIAENSVFLECTRQENIAFYEGFGFKIMEEVELTDTPAHSDKDGKLKYWVMSGNINREKNGVLHESVLIRALQAPQAKSIHIGENASYERTRVCRTRAWLPPRRKALRATRQSFSLVDDQNPR
ncbi:hypothetical protein N7489_004631 [Penicillium chrysogenum]|uniref:uncharacterized protein n=1 Tax=Penicillium chrysogenum TaxID=5076 RepID=UPI0024DF0C78|nr:uncharacterized protein N7489_004631 [Penicillium chrysogenum]KAJ5244535.1 hypothetical protein N7489_004631 [Penicillium chrysogenum]